MGCFFKVCFAFVYYCCSGKDAIISPNYPGFCSGFIYYACSVDISADYFAFIQVQFQCGCIIYIYFSFYKFFGFFCFCIFQGAFIQVGYSYEVCIISGYYCYSFSVFIKGAHSGKVLHFIVLCICKVQGCAGFD